jgi:TolB-like protein/DNA-binding winged helix-turn-helix (wHTH) protein/Flp pilus assembly protein TadD
VEGHFRLGPWLVKPSLNTAVRNGTTSRLTPKAMEVLVCLAEHAGEPVPKEKLIERVWPDTFVGDDALKGLIAEIRRVLEDDAKEPRIIGTIPKRGYRLVAPIESVAGKPGVLQEPLKAETVQIPATPNRKSSISGWAMLASAVLLLLVGGLNVARVRNWLKTNRAPTIHSIAVLPLRNLSADPNQEYLCDGLTDGLITDLAQIGSLKVISHTSTMQYKDTKKSLPEIARELNVDGIIEGTVQRSGNRVRITAQLIHGPSDGHVWANTYERDIGEAFALERDVTEDVTRQVRSSLNAPQALSTQPKPVDVKALEPYLQGQYHLERYGEGYGDEELRQAAASFQQAIDHDPNMAAAYVGLVNAHSRLLWPSLADAEIVGKAAQKAVELDPQSADALVVLGGVKFSRDWDFHGAEEDYRRAITVGPNNALAHGALSGLLFNLGRKDEALREAQIAQELDPTGNDLRDAVYELGDIDRAIALAEADLRANPNDGYLHHGLYRYYATKGMYKEAAQHAEEVFALFGDPEGAARIHKALVSSGPRAGIRQFVTEGENLVAMKRGYFPVNLAVAYAILGDRDHAFYWLEEAYKHHDLHWVSTDMRLVDLKSDPILASLRPDPRYKDLLRRVGLPPTIQ